MKQVLRFLALAALLAAPWGGYFNQVQAQSTLTVADGTATNEYVPLYFYYADANQHNQVIYPASELTEMQGKTITQMQFYSNTTDWEWDGTCGTWVVSMGITASTTLSSPDNSTSLTQVYTTGTINVTSGNIIVVFDNGFTYTGGNLLVDFNYTSAGGYAYDASTYDNILFYGENQAGNAAYCYDAARDFLPKTTFTYETPAACAKPTALAASSVTTTGATLSWTAGGSETSWTVEYGTAADFTGAVSQNVATTPTLNLTGLTANTTYYVRVKAVCGVGDESNWSNTYSFTTACAAASVTSEDYTYGFETADLFECWNVISGTVSRQQYTAHAGSYRLDFRGTTSNMVALPPFAEATNTLRVEFWTRPENSSYDNQYSGKFAVGYMTDISNASTFVPVATYNSTSWASSPAYEKKTVDLVGAPAGARIVFRQFDCSYNYYWYVDDVTVKEIPSCIEPSALAGVATAYNEASISWTAGDPGDDAWQISYKTGAGEWSSPADVTTNPYTLTGLTENTTYDVRVRTNCGDGEENKSEWTAVTFTTPCEAITVDGDHPYAVDMRARTIADCWSQTDGTYLWSFSSTNGATFSTSSYSEQTSTKLVSPLFDFGAGDYWMNFTGKLYGGEDYYGYSDYTATLKVYYRTSPSGAWQELAGQSYSATGETENLNVEEVMLPAGTCQLAFEATTDYSSNYAYTYLYSFAVERVPSCLKPTGLAVTDNSITTDGATITWTAGGEESSWRIEYATDANFTNPSYETVENTPTYTFQSLGESTTYYVHVQADCGSNGTSDYSTVVSFTTLQSPASLPYTNDFESENGWLFVNGNLTNAWAYGEATNNGGTHALYVSNDGGITNAYTNSSADAMVYATKQFNFEAGVYTFSYDWKANGESTYDYLRVALVPSSVELAAATSTPSGFSTTGLPTSWIALDGGSKLNQKTEWQTFASGEMEVAAGNYMMVFAWRNDGSSGSNPPAAIDNVSIQKITCTTPTSFAAPQSGITARTAKLSWTETGEATAWQIELTDENSIVNIIEVTSSQLVEGAYTVTSLDSETEYTAKVRANCGGGNYSSWSSEINFETAEDCQTPDGLAATNVEAHSATITWNTYGQTEFNLRYSDDEGAHWTDVNDVTQPYTLDGVLTANTAYQVKVQATCANAETWSATLNFSTPCDPITVDADNPFTENFDATDFPSSCWDTIKSGTRAWTRNTYKNHNEGGSASAYSGYYGDIYLIMPTLALANDDEAVIRLTFWSYNTYTGSYDKNSVVLLDGNTETELWSPASVSQSWEKTTIDLSAYKGQNITLAFKYEGYNAHGWYVDDLKVEYHYTKSISANSWYAISAPVHNSGNNETLAGVTNLTDDDYDLLRYNETNATWENQKTHNDFILERGKGYIYRTNAAKTLTFNGTRNSGDIDVSLTATNAAGTMKGWNLLGNPYPHTYALARDCYSLSTNGTWTVHDAGSYTMAVAEAVLVKSDNTETFHFTETPSTKSAPASTIAFTVSNDEFTDIAYARFSSEEGLPKISHLNPEAPMLSIDGYAIATLNEGTESFPMSFSGQGSYTLTISGNTDVTGYLHLVDRLTGRDIDLLSTPSYSFTGSPVSDRFTVKLTPDANEGNSTSRFAIFDGNSLIVNGEGTLEVYDVMGRRLMSAEVTGSEYRIPGSDLHTGVYVLRMNGNSQKIVIK